MDEYKNYEREAREKEVGLWAPGVCDIDNSLVAATSDNNTTTTPADEEPNEPIVAGVSATQPPDPNTEDDFGLGFFVGIVVVLIGVGLWKLFKKLFKKKSKT